MKEADLLYAGDTSRDNHLNINGAQKTTNYLGKYIKSNYEITDKRNKIEYSYYLDKQLDQYNCAVQNAKLVNIFDPSEYIDALKSENFTVILVKNKLINDYSQNYKEIIEHIGLDINKVNKQNYYAIIENGKIKQEQGSDGNIHLETIINTNKKLVINTQNASMIFEGAERSNFHPGLDLIVYNNKTNTVVESSYIDYKNGAAIMGR